MAREQIPVTRELITWARERAGYTVEELQKDFKKIEAWEDPSGGVFPTYPQLERLSEKFKVPIAVFFFPEPPRLPPIADSFRTLPEAQFEQIPRRVRFLLRKAKAFQLNLAELCNGQNPAKRNIVRDLEFDTGINLELMARTIRKYIGISLEDQCAWPDSSEALKGWRQAFRRTGIFVFKDAFRTSTFSGFCLYDDVFPIIYVNNSAPKTRQIFTLFHELAHLLFRTSGIDTIGDDFIAVLPDRARRIEVLCNQFAAEFLVPEESFQRAVAGLDPTEETANRLAADFNVSREIIFRKFLDRGLIGKSEYTEAAARWAAQRQPGDGGNTYWNQISYLGRGYIRLALSQYHQNRIDQTKLADYLNWKPKNIRTLEEYFLRGEG